MPLTDHFAAWFYENLPTDDGLVAALVDGTLETLGLRPTRTIDRDELAELLAYAPSRPADTAGES